MRPGPRRHHRDAVGEEDRLGDRVGDEGDGLAGLHPDFLDQQVHLVAGEGVERAERLVHQQHRRIDGKAADDRGALLHAARQFARDTCSRSRQGRPGRAVCRCARGPAAVPLQLERQLDVLLQVAPRQQVGVLEDHRDLPGAAASIGFAAEHDPAAGQPVQPGHRPQQRGLAAARGAEDAEELALAHVE